MNTEDIHTALHSQTADTGHHTPARLTGKEDMVQIKVCAVDLICSLTSWHTLAFSLIRLLKRIQGRTIIDVKYTAIVDDVENSDGRIGTLTVILEHAHDHLPTHH